MKAITIYRCEKCGSQFNTEEAALRCEENHGVPVEIIDKKYKYEDMIYGYPRSIEVKMSNGKTCEYVYSHIKEA